MKLKASCRCGAVTHETDTHFMVWEEERSFIDGTINECASSGGPCKPIDRTAAIVTADDNAEPVVGVAIPKRRGRKAKDDVQIRTTVSAETRKRGRKPLTDEQRAERLAAYLALHPNSKRNPDYTPREHTLKTGIKRPRLTPEQKAEREQQRANRVRKVRSDKGKPRGAYGPRQPKDDNFTPKATLDLSN